MYSHHMLLCSRFDIYVDSEKFACAAFVTYQVINFGNQGSTGKNDGNWGNAFTKEFPLEF